MDNSFCFIACSDDEIGGGSGNDDGIWIDVAASSANWDGEKRADISYQLLVYSFADSNGDKCGDIRGLITKLDYLNDLGIKAIWLSPIHPAMSYHGYDVTDYSGLNPQYGTMADFEELVTKAHSLGIKIYLDYVMNHTGVHILGLRKPRPLRTMNTVTITSSHKTRNPILLPVKFQ